MDVAPLYGTLTIVVVNTNSIIIIIVIIVSTNSIIIIIIATLNIVIVFVIITTIVDQANGGRKYGTSLGGCLYAPVHQHFFVARIDFCVDGQHNSIVEYNAKAESEDSHNPTLNGFYFEEKILESELMAVRDLSPETAR